MKKILFVLLAIAGLVACDSKEPSVELKPQLLVDKAEIIANGEDVSIIEDIVAGKKIGTKFHANVNHTFNLEDYIMESMD